MLKAASSRLAKDSLIYGVGNGLTRFIQIITLPIASRALSVGEFGDWNLLALSAGVLSSFMVFGMENAVIRFMYDDNSEIHKKELFTTGLTFILSISLVLVLLFWQLDKLILDLINLNQAYSSAFKITVVWLPAIALQTYLLNWFKWTLQKWKFIIISFGFVTLNLSSLLIANELNILDVNILLLSTCCSQWVAILIGLLMCREQFLFKIDFSLVKRMIIYGLPFMFVMLIGALRNSIDRFILSDFSSGNDQLVGLYSMGQRLGMIINFFVYTMDILLGPLILSNWDSPDAKFVIAKLQKYYLLFMNWIAISICSFAPILIKVLATDEYISVIKYLPIFTIGNYFLGLYVFASIGILYSKKSYLNTFALILSLIALYVVAYLLTPIYLEWGVALAYLVSVVVMIVSGYQFSKKYFQIKFNWNVDILIVLVGVFLSLITVNLKIANDFILNSFIMFFSASTLYMIFTFMIFSDEERSFFMKSFKRK